MPSRPKAAPKKKPGKSAPVRKPAPAKKKAAAKPSATPASVIQKPPPFIPAPIGGTPPRAVPATVAAKPPVRPVSAGQVATAQQAEERRKAATRKLFARIRSLEAIVGADLRKRGSLLLSQAVDQWYAEATSATATDVSITNAARAVISQL